LTFTPEVSASRSNISLRATHTAARRQAVAAAAWRAATVARTRGRRSVTPVTMPVTASTAAAPARQLAPIGAARIIASRLSGICADCSSDVASAGSQNVS
jgi:hypothetical protein